MKTNVTVKNNNDEAFTDKQNPNILAEAHIYVDLGVTINFGGISNKASSNISIPINFSNRKDDYRAVRIYIGREIINAISRIHGKSQHDHDLPEIDANYCDRRNKVELGFSHGLSQPLGNWEFVKVNVGIHRWCDVAKVKEQKKEMLEFLEETIDMEKKVMELINSGISVSDYLLLTQSIENKKFQKTFEKEKDEINLLGGNYVFNFGKYSPQKMKVTREIKTLSLKDLHSYYTFLKNSENLSENAKIAIANIEKYFEDARLEPEIELLKQDPYEWQERANAKASEESMNRMGEPPF
jgi:hypothetical protein